MNTTITPHTYHLQIENLDYESCNHKGPFRVVISLIENIKFLIIIALAVGPSWVVSRR